MRKLIHGQRKVSLSFLALALVLAAVFVVQGCQIRQNSKTTRALCVFKADLEQRVAGTDKFLKEHPGAEPIPGIPRKLLIQGRDNQQRTIDSLDELDCP